MSRENICILGVGDAATLPFLKKQLSQLSKTDSDKLEGNFVACFLNPANSYVPAINTHSSLSSKDPAGFVVDLNIDQIKKSTVIFIIATGAERQKIIEALKLYFGGNSYLGDFSNCAALRGKVCFILEAPDETQGLSSEVLDDIFGHIRISLGGRGYQYVDFEGMEKEVNKVKGITEPAQQGQQGPVSTSGNSSSHKRTAWSTLFFGGSSLSLLTSATLTGLAIAGILTFTPAVVAGIAASAALALVLLLIAAYARYKEKHIEQYRVVQYRFLQEQGL